MPNIADLVRQLRAVKHFSAASNEEVEQTIRMGTVQTYVDGETLFHEESPSAGLFVLLSGQVQLCKLSPQGQNAILAVFDPVIMFNEVAALDGGPNPVTAVAVGETVVWRLAADPLEALILRHPQVAMGLLRVLAARNRRLVSQFEDLSFRPVLARAAKLLLELSANGAHPIDRRKHPNHRMAARIATVPEAFSRSLKVFRTGGCIACSGSSINILSVERLQAAAEMNDRVA